MIGEFLGSPAAITILATNGHIFKIDFEECARDWDEMEPSDLLDPCTKTVSEVINRDVPMVIVIKLFFPCRNFTTEIS